jgi:hypothetical protein
MLADVSLQTQVPVQLPREGQSPGGQFGRIRLHRHEQGLAGGQEPIVHDGATAKLVH